MKRSILVFSGIFMVCAGLAAEPAKTLPGLEGGMLKIQNVPEFEEKKEPAPPAPEIQDDRRNVQVLEEGENPPSSPASPSSARPSSWIICQFRSFHHSCARIMRLSTLCFPAL